MKRYYVHRSSYFDAHPYNSRKIAAAVKRGGGRNVRMSYAYGWSNQPKVVTFSAPGGIKQIESELHKSMGVWLMLMEKEW